MGISPPDPCCVLELKIHAWDLPAGPCCVLELPSPLVQDSLLGHSHQFFVTQQPFSAFPPVFFCKESSPLVHCHRFFYLQGQPAAASRCVPTEFFLARTAWCSLLVHFHRFLHAQPRAPLVVLRSIFFSQPMGFFTFLARILPRPIMKPWCMYVCMYVSPR